MIYSTILCLGDSLTYPARDPTFLGYPGYLAQDVQEDLGQFCMTINKGVNGETSAQLLFRAYDVIKSYPDCQTAILLIGTNDTKHEVDEKLFKSNLEQIIGICKVFDKKVLISTLPPIKVFGQPTYRQDSDDIRKRYNEVIRNLAEEKDLAMVELGNLPAKYQCDGVHFNTEGSRFVAKKMLKGLKRLK